MKRFAILAGIVFLISNCANDNISPQSTATTVLGKWKVVKDSLNFGGDQQSYLKSDSDYYNFISNGILIVKEDGVTDTATYSLSSDNYINILFKKNPRLVFVEVKNNGVVIKDSIINRFSAKFYIDEFSSNSLNFSTSFHWSIPQPPIIADSGTSPNLIDVNIVTELKK